MLKQCATLLLALALSLCLQCHSAAAARKLHQAVVRLIPTYAKMYGHDVYYQVPQSPIGTVFLAHGCVHSGADYWPPSSACPECRGLPMELAHTKQALARGYAVVAVSSADRTTGCFSWWVDNAPVASILADLKSQWGLSNAPVYAFGVSAGGAFVLKMPRLTRFDGVVAEAEGIPVADWGLNDMTYTYPPTVFMEMPKDTITAAKISDDIATMESNNWPVSIVKLMARPIYPGYFSDMSPFVSLNMSVAVYLGLQQIGMLDNNSFINQDPRYTKYPWQQKLTQVVPSLTASDVASDNSQIYELMNVAYAWHEINGEYVTACLAWFESKGKSRMSDMVRQWKITGPLANLTADRYTPPAAPPQAGGNEVTAAAMLSTDTVATFDIPQPDPPVMIIPNVPRSVSAGLVSSMSIGGASVSSDVVSSLSLYNVTLPAPQDVVVIPESQKWLPDFNPALWAEHPPSSPSIALDSVSADSLAAPTAKVPATGMETAQGATSAARTSSGT